MKEVYEKIVSDLGDYMKKAGLESMVLGISGGIDSTVCAIICREVADRDGLKSIGISMPFKNKPDEVESAEGVLKGWYGKGERFRVPIEDIYYAFQIDLSRYITYKDSIFPCADDIEKYELVMKNRTKLANGNIMARIRMTILYDIAGLRKGLVIDTDNLTENYLGFFTIHGDQGDYKPIGNLWKTDVYKLGKWMLENLPLTPEQKETLAKSLSLVPTDGNDVSTSDMEQIGAKDYEEVDSILREYIEGIPGTYTPEAREKVLKRMRNSEFKRKPTPKALD